MSATAPTPTDSVHQARTPKIRLEKVSKIFGRHADRALELLAQGLDKKTVQERTGVVVGVYDVSLEIAEGEIFVIMGLSGCGKSTLLRLINRLHEPTTGKVFIGEEDITAMGAHALRRLRRSAFGMVFQSFALLPHRNVLSNVEFGLELHGVPRPTRRERAQQAIETVGLSGYEHKYPDELSGGMQQRVGLARALAVDPQILLMDEAFSALDPLIRGQLQDDLIEIQERVGTTVVFVSHDLDEAIKIGTRIAILRDGRLVQVGTPQEILAAPADDYVSAFVRGADRTKVLTAADVMLPLHTFAHLRDSPRALLRKMQHSGFSGLIVLDNQRHPLGYVELRQVIEMRDQARLERSALRPLPCAAPEEPLSELIRRSNVEGSPMVVCDAKGRVIGVIDKTTLLAALAQQGETDESAAATSEQTAEQPACAEPTPNESAQKPPSGESRVSMEREDKS
ncbi:MAG: glycine betaine/L-proline ABC transporter ATP-binding protein [Tepidiphilus sp.]|uniref:quaternary amine ABC transporter ATP-binding protein n=1 Tax=Tepidiphilus succinatimandens TaxID=224436 RepID=UPI00112F3BF1|nr:glycine betaine/L-proline ABC transporter ATP-binding protein [Tepidiphilus succinatimandens]MDD2407700.1 glycine betaine/L-proline ABC transporter ATP-binding protein [Tepidiphilus sp.]MDK2798010.1 glycine betaine/proline transport system ATP-binding protein [Tepidiphilus sp.]